MYRALDTYPARIQRVSNVSRCILRDTSVSGLYLHFKVRIHTLIYAPDCEAAWSSIFVMLCYTLIHARYIYLGYISPDTFQIQL